MTPNVTRRIFSIFYFIFLIGVQVAPTWGSAIFSSEYLKTHYNHTVLTYKPSYGLLFNPCIREDYIHTPGVGYHKLHRDAVPWNEARKICNEENAHLAIINSKAEHNALSEVLNREVDNMRNSADKNRAFLGIHDLYKEGEWVSILGDSLYSLGYREWCPGQPDNSGQQHCGALVGSNCGIDDVRCDQKLAFFCELPDYCYNAAETSTERVFETLTTEAA